MRRGVSVVLLGLSVAFSANALDIKGKIKDRKSGEGIIGATVCLKEDPTKGVVSGLDGSFSLSLKEGQTLVCSYIGYKPTEVKVSMAMTDLPAPTPAARTLPDLSWATQSFWKSRSSTPAMIHSLQMTIP